MIMPNSAINTLKMTQYTCSVECSTLFLPYIIESVMHKFESWKMLRN